jgi:hypothetical protein
VSVCERERERERERECVCVCVKRYYVRLTCYANNFSISNVKTAIYIHINRPLYLFFDATADSNGFTQ